MSTIKRRYEISDEDWNRVKEMLPPERTGKRGRPCSIDNRLALNAMLWINRSGAAWRDLPERYGKWQTFYDRFCKWSKTGVFEKIFIQLTKDSDMQDIPIDSTSIKVHQSAAGAKKGLKTPILTKE